MLTDLVVLVAQKYSDHQKGQKTIAFYLSSPEQRLEILSFYLSSPTQRLEILSFYLSSPPQRLEIFLNTPERVVVFPKLAICPQSFLVKSKRKLWKNFDWKADPNVWTREPERREVKLNHRT